MTTCPCGQAEGVEGDKGRSVAGSVAATDAVQTGRRSCGPKESKRFRFGLGLGLKAGQDCDEGRRWTEEEVEGDRGAAAAGPTGVREVGGGERRQRSRGLRCARRPGPASLSLSLTHARGPPRPSPASSNGVEVLFTN